MSINKHVNFMCSRGFEDSIYFIVLPWLPSLISHAVDDTWSKSVFYYGLTYSMFNFGKLLGYLIGGTFQHQRPRYPLFFIVVGFIGIGFSNRMSLILFSIFCIGFGGAIMGAKGTSNYHNNISNLDTSGKIISPIDQIENRIDILTQRKIIINIFIVLFSGLSYQEGSLFPGVIPCLWACLICVLVFTIRSIQIWITKDIKYNWKVRKTNARNALASNNRYQTTKKSRHTLHAPSTTNLPTESSSRGANAAVTSRDANEHLKFVNLSEKWNKQQPNQLSGSASSNKLRQDVNSITSRKRDEKRLSNFPNDDEEDSLLSDEEYEEISDSDEENSSNLKNSRNIPHETSQSLITWMTNHLLPFDKSISSSSSTSSSSQQGQAYLGEENQYVYNEISKTWTLSPAAAASAARSRGNKAAHTVDVRGSKLPGDRDRDCTEERAAAAAADDEERLLVQAIQAAHLAHNYCSGGSSSSGEGGESTQEMIRVMNNNNSASSVPVTSSHHHHQRRHHHHHPSSLSTLRGGGDEESQLSVSGGSASASDTPFSSSGGNSPLTRGRTLSTDGTDGDLTDIFSGTTASSITKMILPQTIGSGNNVYKNINNNYSSSSKPQQQSTWSSPSRKTDNSSINSSSTSASKIPTNIFLLVIFISFTASFIECMIHTLLPIWLSSEASRGGLEYSVRNLSFIIPSAGVVVFIAHSVFKSRLAYIFKASPVRSVRVGCGALIVMCFVLPLFLHSNKRLFSITSTVTAVSGISSSTLSLSSPPVLIAPQTKLHLILQQYEGWSNPFDFPYQPLPLASLLLPALTLAMLVIGAYITTQASRLLLYIVLSPYFVSPRVMIFSLTCACDTLGPVVSVVLFISAYQSDLHYPMDASFFLTVCASFSLLIYLSSLVLSVQFRGDFGVMMDDMVTAAAAGSSQSQDESSMKSARGTGTSTARNSNRSDKNYSNTQLSKRNSFANISNATAAAFSSYANSGSSSSSSGSSSFLNNKIGKFYENGSVNSFIGLGSLLAVPFEDFSLLFSTPISGYGTKLHDLKIGSIHEAETLTKMV